MTTNNKLANRLYLSGFIAFALAIACAGIFLYLAPHFILQVKYHTPLFVSHIMHHIETEHGIEGYWLGILTLLPFLLFAIVLFLIAAEYNRLYEGLSKRSDQNEIGNRFSAQVINENKAIREAEVLKEPTAASYTIKILFGILLVFVGLAIVDWVFSFYY